jgi:O-antigen/teichoic acid export membrane protein
MKSLPFFKGLSWLIFLNLLVKPVWLFFIDRQVQNIVGHETYGKYFALLNLSYVLFFLSDGGLSTMFGQRLASNRHGANTRQFLGIKVFFLFLFAITTCFVAWLTHITQWSFLFYILLIQALNSLFIFLRSIITAHQLFSADAWFSIADKFLMTVFCGLLIYTTAFGSIDLEIFLQIQSLCTALAVLAAVIFIGKKKLVSFGTKENNGRIIISIFPFAVSVLLMALHSRLDGFLLERIHINGAYEAGIYASAFRLLDAGNMVGYLSATFLVPFIAKNQNDKQLVQSVVINTRHGLIVLATGLVCFTFFFSSWIQELLYYSNDPYHSMVIQLCVAVLPAYYMLHFYSSVLTGTTGFDLLIPILAVSALLNIILNLVLIPAHGAKGCCIAALVSQYACAFACYIAATKRIGISYGAVSFVIYLALATLLCAWFYFGKMAVNNVWIILAIAAGAVVLVLAIQFRFFKKYFISIR